MMTDPTSPAPLPSAPADRGLRDRIAAAIHTDLLATAYRRDQGLLGIVPRLTDAVLAVLPAPTDRAAVLREAADALEALDPTSAPLVGYHARGEDIGLLRRMADEAQPAAAPAIELPGSSAPLAAGMPLVQGRCPACGTAGLFLGNGGYVTCSLLDCREPDAASTVLERQPDPTRSVLEEVHAERTRQDEKWGEQHHPDGTGGPVMRQRADAARAACQYLAANGGPDWRAILLEEVYEALAVDDPDRLRAELVQVAAVACAWAEAIDRRAAAPAKGSDH